MELCPLHILIDDERNLEADIVIRRPEFVHQVLSLFSDPNSYELNIYLDHDLGSTNPKYTGVGLLPALLQIDAVKYIQLITSNPVGRANMEVILKHEGWTFNYITNFWEKED